MRGFPSAARPPRGNSGWLAHSLFSLVALATLPAHSAAAESSCRGTTANGALENGCKLPLSGVNLSAYSYLGSMLGRTYVHCTVSEILLDVRWVYGETGLAEGGPFKPHKTHQNGLSVDFFVPVRNARGASVELPTHPLNKWGYDIELDAWGRLEELTIDFEAMTRHILALYQRARARGVGIRRVIFDPQLQPRLHSTEAWPRLEGRVEFSQRRSWVRHDEHYHVDFEIPCEPL